MNIVAQRLRPKALGNITFLMSKTRKLINSCDDELTVFWGNYWAARGDVDVESLDKKTKQRVNSIMSRIQNKIYERQGLQRELVDLGKHAFIHLQGDQECFL